MAKIPWSEYGLDEEYVTVHMKKELNQKININPPGSGLLNTPGSPTVWGYNKPDGVWEAECQGAYIVAGNFGPGNATGGEVAQGVLSPTVDIVVGRNSSARKGQGPEKGSMVDSNFVTDAARVYISKLTNLDRYFGLAANDGANAGAYKGRSGVGVKADRIAVIGREGVKIVSGRQRGARVGMSGETNSLGGKVTNTAPKIELIAGNNYQGVQGVALGEVTRDSLRELHDIIQDILGCVYNFITLQTAWDGVLGVTPLPHHAAGAAPKSMGNLTMVMSTLYSSRINLMIWHFNTLSPYGGQYIVSRNVRTN